MALHRALQGERLLITIIALVIGNVVRLAHAAQTLHSASAALDQSACNELAAAIDDYRVRHVPLIVPISLFQHYARSFDIGYLREQVYLESDPDELMLRNLI